MTDSYVSSSGAPDDGGPDDASRLEGLLSGDAMPTTAMPEMEYEMSVTRLLGALRAPGRPDELGALESTTAAFLAARAETLAAGGVVVPLTAPRRRPAVVAGAAVAGVLAAVAIAGTAAAALGGALPDPIQRWAHDAVGAPAPLGDQDDSGTTTTGAGSSAKPTSTSTSTSASGQGPSAGPSAAAVVGLCRSFGTVTGSQTGSTAYRTLTAAAVATGTTVERYCAGILATAKPAPSTKPTAPPGSTQKPTAPPGSTQKPTVAPGSTQKPASAGTGSTVKSASPKS